MNATATRPTFDTAFFKRLPSLTGWAIAGLYGLHYEGDSNAIDHGGTFYNLSTWDKWGYASCVELYPIEGERGEGSLLMVSSGVIYRPNDDTLRAALASCDVPNTADTATIVDAIKSYCGAEPCDQLGHTYTLSNWPNEWRLWKSIHPLLLSLSQK